VVVSFLVTVSILEETSKKSIMPSISTTTTPTTTTFREDVEEARKRQNHLRAQESSSWGNPSAGGGGTTDNDDDDVSSFTTFSPHGKTFCVMLLLALLLGTTGTVLSILNLVQDNDKGMAVTQDGHSTSNNDKDDTSSHGNGQSTSSSAMSSPTLDAIRQRGSLYCGLPLANTPGK
jgi:hypothetical protein